MHGFHFLKTFITVFTCTRANPFKEVAKLSYGRNITYVNFVPTYSHTTNFNTKYPTNKNAQLQAIFELLIIFFKLFIFNFTREYHYHNYIIDY